mmetsp:Transcript_32162/g.88870  ORF Transcript_32162/g.88870 Transcript_32162/m.88870 type:complete len:380 (+) Transcript_32162:93-1232(+)
MSPREALGAHGSGQLPLELVTVTTEQLASASAAGAPGPELEHLLDRAFGADGLGVICITGDDSFQARVRRIREDLLPLALALDRLPDADKAAIAEAGTLNVNNYSRGIDGNRSGLYFHPATDTPGDCLPAGIEPEPTFYAQNLWPDAALPELRPRARDAAPFLVDVGRELALVVDQRLASAIEGYRPRTLVDLAQGAECCNHKCRLICYHEYESETQRKDAKGMWAPPHKDTGLFTVLVPGVFFDSDGAQRLPACPDPEVGLYVRSRRGAITQISAPAGSGECLFFQLGEAMQIVSGGLYHATEHCVRGPPAAQAGYLRASLAVFFQPHAHEDLEVPEGLSLRDVAGRATDGMLRMFLLCQPEGATRINFLTFCHREGF